MKTFLKVIRDIFGIPELRRRVFITFALLGIYRIGFHIYLPGIDMDALGRVITEMERTGGSGLVAFLNMTSALTGAALSRATIFSLGIMPYISASIIFSLLVKVFPRLEALQKEGESGRRIINRYTRYSTVALCLVQSIFVVVWLRSSQGSARVVISEVPFMMHVLQVMVLTSGTVFLMWLGEKITEHGIGNGISLIIMAGIIARMPGALITLGKGAVDASSDERAFFILKLLFLCALFFAIVAAVVYITKGQRRIPVQQARTVKGRKVYGGQKHYMPIRVNSAGVLPIIFAQSLIMLPTGALAYVVGEENSGFLSIFAPGSFWYMVLYALLIGFFTYFWTSLMFNPAEISENMKEYGSFIPGIRPGRRTAEYLTQVLNRITLTGAVFLAVIALVPQIVTDTMDINIFVSGFLGGTGMLIVVGVALDLVDKIEAQLLVRHYEGFMRAGGEGAGKGGSS
ncbi:MAG: preprotein translocase subunit SecY [Planctomycetota bacterium]